MSFATTTFYNVFGRKTVISSNLPSNYLSTFSQSVAGNAGSNALALDVTTSGASLAGQKSFQNTFSAITTGTNQDLGVAQFLSSPLTAQSHNSETWTFFGAAQVSNASATFTWTFKGALYLVDGTNGTIKTTIIALANPTGAAANRTGTAEVTIKGTATGAAFTAAAGDYLALEWGINMNNSSGGSLSPNITMYGEGITGIGSDNASTTNANTSIVSTTNVTVYPIVGRAQLPLSPLEQPRGPGWVRDQLSLPPVEQVRGPGWVRVLLPISPSLQPRAGDVDQVLMRGFDSLLNKTVYWVSGAVDPLGTQYSGDQSKLSDIVVITLTNVNKI